MRVWRNGKDGRYKTIQKVELAPYQEEFQKGLLDSVDAYMDAPIEVIDQAAYIAERPEEYAEAEALAKEGIVHISRI